MRPLRALLIFFLFVFVGGALIAPWLHWLAQHAAAAHLIPAKLAREPFSRYVNRALLLMAIVGLKPLARQLGANSWSAIGLVRPRPYWKNILAGFALGFVSLALVAGTALMCGGRDWEPDLQWAKVLPRLFSTLAAAIVVAVIEEILFRGGIFGGLRRVFTWPWALAFSSGIYAIVHFFASTPLPGPVTWLSGFQQLAQMLSGFLNLHALVPGFLNLTLAGVLLGLAYQRTGNLWFSIGLHAGWIFWLKGYGLLSAERPGTNLWFWGSGNLIDGWLAGGALLLSIVVFHCLSKRLKKNQTMT